MTATKVDDWEDETPTRRRVRRTITTIVLLLCVVGLVVMAQHTERGDKDEPKFSASRNSVVRLQQPTPEQSVLSQAQVLIDLTTNYDASLVIAGVRIPDNELQRRPELNEVSFLPGPGKSIERLPAGRVCVEADIFRVDNAPEDVPPVTWCFNVT